MTIAEIKAQLHQHIDQMTDEAALRALQWQLLPSGLSALPVVPSLVMTDMQAQTKATEAIAQIEAGLGVSHTEVTSMSAQW